MAQVDQKDARGCARHKGDPNHAIRISDEVWVTVATNTKSEGLAERWDGIRPAAEVARCEADE
jgi:hypothetical protein